MAAYAALASLAQTTDLDRNPGKSLFSINAMEKIRSIRTYVDFLVWFLENYPEKANRWEGKIRDVAHQTEDIIELFMWQKMQSRYIQMNPSSVVLEDLLKDVTLEIGTIVGETMEERPAYSHDAVSSSSQLATMGKDAVIGLDDDLMSIKERLCGQSSALQFIPIVGMGGIGKTTLARTIYDDQLIIEHFQIRAWVTVSQDYNPDRFRRTLLGHLKSMKLLEEPMPRMNIDRSEVAEEMYENLMKQVLGEKIDESEMSTRVHKHLKSRRYLIVIDDIWSTEVWDDVRHMFPDDVNGSRIMFTTRLSDVATYPDFCSPPHEMRFMDDNQSWHLLHQTVLANNNCPLDLEDVGKQIALRCRGLPLALILVAGLLSAVNKTRASWEEIAENLKPVVDGELGEILSLSYTHLPHYLRTCFLFLGGFPEDDNICASRLFRLWIAEGFLKHQNGCRKSLEEKAEEYLEDLVKRNLVLVTSRKSCGNIKNCKLHDMVRDLCIRKAKQEKFLHVMDGCSLPQSMIKERRISSVSCSGIDHIWGPTIHTILGIHLDNFPGWPNFLGCFRLLRILDAVDNKHKVIPSQVFELFHLRYLAFTGSFNIPSAISNLVNLQTLIIRPTFSSRTRYCIEGNRAVLFSLPLEIWRMPQLRHLVFYDLYILPPPLDISTLPLENLQTLSPIQNLVWTEKILQLIPNVKKLGLVYQINQEYHLHLLKHLHKLEKLEITGYLGFSWWRQNPTFPMTLKKLTLVGGGFPWKDMAIIGSLPNLEVLKLLDYACDGETWETTDEEFPQLKFLLIDKSGLRQWITQSSHFPKLKCLALHSCWHLSEIPECIGEISTLELIEVDHNNKCHVESANQIKDDQVSYGNYDLQVRVIHSNEGKGGDRFTLFTDDPRCQIQESDRNIIELTQYKEPAKVTSLHSEQETKMEGKCCYPRWRRTVGEKDLSADVVGLHRERAYGGEAPSNTILFGCFRQWRSAWEGRESQGEKADDDGAATPTRRGLRAKVARWSCASGLA